MDMDYLFDFLATTQLTFFIAIAALVVAIVALFSASAARRAAAEQSDTVKQRVESLWHDMDEIRVSQFNGPDSTEAGRNPIASEQFSAEKAAYEAIWPLVWLLHDKLGMFLRSVESDEPAGELRLEARKAALDARSTLNRVRPFCHDDVDGLITQLIDNHIKAHLAACHFMDLRKDSLSSNTSHEREVQKEKFHTLYEGQSRELLNQLVGAIRRRMLR
ncbi:MULTISPECIES: hypothetical protein [Marinobacter]|jgi:hypothetical protein|uniref:DUF4760 domain-containing protein n=1 Tax=Marinobacter salarius TaxID=1420917 RepID=A0ABY1FHJ1_9GAMM|nr:MULTISPECIES: hypothetical protein [Marinobacter]AZR42171.1 hypothetical protein MTMN5_02723 [Marinobacter salarius]KXJ48573.1 MAG: hypothetical protein AXW11_02035 [Marinobacter sp. Hex_13]MAB52868.1 hypothetical protein [Marinobacter sp.]MBJ7301602.1 hypothetical protein [Marinobacter salarius]MBL82973.1 hypothetical protein [Marinobacter sp.]|tara:strand:+ start:217 stop:870 length:654 start_codon:yes stop_codon:yes gene_type:complete